VRRGGFSRRVVYGYTWAQELIMTLMAERTYAPEEFLRLPDSVGFELVDGHLVERNVSEESSGVAMRIGYLLQIETDKTHEARVYGADLTYNCIADPSRELCRADVSLIRKTRLEGLDNPGMMPIPADLVVEVLSPNDLAYAVNRKVERYLSSGFKLVWVVDPEVKIVYVHRDVGPITKLRENDEITGEAALPGFRRNVAEFFVR
jgi:Uma2 family endonuclease